jgi:hypothetical protein
MFSDPNSIGSAWWVWVWWKLSREEWQDSVPENGEGVGKGGARNIFCPGLLNKYINIF